MVKLERQCMSDKIRAELARRIFDGALQAGQRLVELDIAKEFDTSQTPVREALRELESQRLVESVPYRGTRVREISKQDMAEAYAVRGSLEQLAGELAASRIADKLPELRDTLRALHRAAKTKDVEGYTKHNFDFHRCIVEASGNQVLIQLWKSLSFETRMRVNIAQSNPNLMERADEHDPILQALADGHGKQAGKLLRDHAQSFMAFWKQ